jgi:uncharacterized protein (UPF0332 family)
VLKLEQWQEKSESSLEASRILLENNKPVEAVSRAYYAAYQMVTGVLIKLNLSPRDEFGNWSHHETVRMYRVHICQKSDLGYKEKQALKGLHAKFRALLERRYRADYGTPSKADLSLVNATWRDANRLVSLLKSLITRGLL